MTGLLGSWIRQRIGITLNAHNLGCISEFIHVTSTVALFCMATETFCHLANDNDKYHITVNVSQIYRVGYD